MSDQSDKEIIATFYSWEEFEDLYSPEFTSLLISLRKTIGGHLCNSAGPNIDSLEGMQGCLDRLDAFFLQVSRMAAHADISRWRVGPNLPSVHDLVPESALCLSAHEACTDFESLLFHARAALDRLTLFISREHGQRSSRFTTLWNRKMLEQFAEKDDRPSQLLEIMVNTKGIEGVLVDVAGKNLRSQVAHRSSISEGTTVVFTVYRLRNGRYLVFDCEALGYPVLATARMLSIEIPYFALNSIVIYLGEGNILSYSDFEPRWENRSVVYSNFIDETNQGPLIPVAGRMIPNGVRPRWEHLNPKIFDYSISFE